MKKIATTFCLLSSFLFGYSQGLVLFDHNHNIVTNTIIDINLLPDSSAIEEILIKNSGSVTDTLKVIRTVKIVDAGDLTQFCFGGLCYAHATNVSSLTLTVAAGDTVDYSENGFHALFTAGNACVTRTVRYRFYNINNFADSASVTLRYLCATGVDEDVVEPATISFAYPNPANSSVAFKYAMNGGTDGKIIFYDMVGKAVKTVTLNDKQGTAKVNITDLTAGIYFYTFMVDQKAISTRKLIVN
ncbi:MAG: T9SS type A sorting domain-containing protein [Bacteroidota bacterium]